MFIGSLGSALSAYFRTQLTYTGSFLGSICSNAFSPMLAIGLNEWFFQELSLIDNSQEAIVKINETRAVFRFILTIISSSVSDPIYLKWATKGIFAVTMVLYCITAIAILICVMPKTKSPTNDKHRSISPINALKSIRFPSFIVILLMTAYRQFVTVFQSSIHSHFIKPGDDLPIAFFNGVTYCFALFGGIVYRRITRNWFWYAVTALCFLGMLYFYDSTVILFWFVNVYMAADGALIIVDTVITKAYFNPVYRGQLQAIVSVLSGLTSSQLYRLMGIFDKHQQLQMFFGISIFALFLSLLLPKEAKSIPETKQHIE